MPEPRHRRRFPAQPAFHIAVNGQTTGPFQVGQLQVAVQQGQLNRDSLVWADGMPGWTAAGQVPALSVLFAPAAPPPPPPPAAPAPPAPA
ncbi:DUF4339 domain-containing protein [Naumannella halotolerans]|uniref:DUF4339 domain-containing protein n=1 Tax=Naumannella halotolerans TaxID=993414 RepID=UPI00370DA94C